MKHVRVTTAKLDDAAGLRPLRHKGKLKAETAQTTPSAETPPVTPADAFERRQRALAFWRDAAGCSTKLHLHESTNCSTGENW